MTTPHIDHTVIDFAAHCHMYGAPPMTAAAIEEELGGPIYSDIDAYEERYRQAGIERAVLSQTPFMGGTDVEEVKRANDTLLNIIEQRDRFYGLASLSTGAGGAAAADEFERCLDNGFHGGAIETLSAGTEVHDSELTPVFEVADKSKAPLMVHPKLIDSIKSPLMDDRLALNAVVGRDVALCISICKVVHSGVLDRFQDLHLVYHHFGGNVATVLARLHNILEKSPPEIRADDSAESFKSYDEFKAQLEDRIYIDTSGYYGDRQVLRSALKSFPVSQLIFGTDFPYETRSAADFDRMTRSIMEEMSRGDAKAVLGGNVEQLLVNCGQPVA